MNNLALIIIISLFQAVYLLIGYFLGRNTKHNIFDDVKIEPKKKKEMLDKIMGVVGLKTKTEIISPVKITESRRLVDELTDNNDAL